MLAVVAETYPKKHPSSSACRTSKKSSPSYSKKMIKNDQIVLRKAYPKISKKLSARGVPSREIDRAVVKSLTQFRKASPKGRLTAFSFQRKTLAFVKLVINSVPEGAKVDVINIRRNEKDSFTTNAAFWAIPSKYLISATMDGFCDWEKELLLKRNDELLELYIEFEVDCP
jgi:hypothetical protein